MLATRISFMNDLANLCELLGADIELVRRGMGTDPRIGPKFLFAGPGFGGSCFPKDLRAAISTGRDVGYKLEILDAVVAVNERQKRRLGEKIIAHFGGTLDRQAHRRVGAGVQARHRRHARGAGADAHRSAAARRAPPCAATDPVAMEAVRKLLGDRIEFETSNYTCAEGADALALVTEWHEYRRPNFDRLKTMMRQPVLFDGRNVWEPNEVRALGFRYHGIGR